MGLTLTLGGGLMLDATMTVIMMLLLALVATALGAES